MFSGDFFKKQSILDQSDIDLLEAYNAEIESGTHHSIAFKNTMREASVTAQNLARNAKGAAVDIGAIPKVSKAATLGIKAFAVAGNMLLTMGISWAISTLMSKFTEWTQEAERAKEATLSFNNSINEFNSGVAKNKKTIKDLNDRYKELSKSIDSYGQNINLTADEYSEYKNIISQVSDIMPELSVYFNDQGEKIGFVKENLVDLNKEYEKYQQNAARKFVTEGDGENTKEDIFKNYRQTLGANDVDGYTKSNIGWRLLGSAIAETFTLGFFDDVEFIYTDYGIASKLREIQSVSTKEEAVDGIHIFGTIDEGEQRKIFGATRREIEKMTDAEFNAWRKNLSAYIQKYEAEMENAYQSIRNFAGQLAKSMDKYWDKEIAPEERDAISSLISGMSRDIIEEFENEDGEISEELINIYVSDLIKGFANDETSEYISEIMSGKLLEGIKNMPIEEASKELSAKLRKIQEVTGLDDYTFYYTFEVQFSDYDIHDQELLDIVHRHFGSNDFDSNTEREIINSLRGLSYDEFMRVLKRLDGFQNRGFLNEKELRNPNFGYIGYINEIIDDVRTDIENEENDKNVFVPSLETLQKASENISTLSSAFKELSDDGYITTKTLGELQTATGLSDDEWAKYETRLLNAKKGSADSNQALSELTYKILENKFTVEGLANATEEQISVVLRENGVANDEAMAHEISTKAKAENKMATNDLAGAIAREMKMKKKLSEATIEGLLEEYGVLGLTEGQVYSLIAAEGIFNNTDLDTSQKKQALKELMLQAGLTETAINSVFDDVTNSSGGKKKQDGAKKNGLIILGDGQGDDFGIGDMTGKDWTYNGQNLNSWAYLDPDTGIVYDAYEDGSFARSASKVMAQFDNMANWEIPEYGSGDSKGKDTLDNYLEHAETLYSVHQNESKYINDLQWAYNNLAKTEDERLDIAKKIDEAYRDMADNRIKDIEHEIEMTKNLKGENADVAAQLDEIQRIAHEEANRLRAMGYDDNSDEVQEMQKQWWDAEDSKLDWRLNLSKDWIDERNRLGDWHLFDDNEVAAWERVIKWLKEEYPHAIDEIKEAEEELFEARKDQLDELSDFGSSYLDSHKTLLEAYYDTTNAIEESFHEINKELEASKAMYEWLDEDTRKLLFNQEDYNALSEELYDIQYKAEKLQRQYQHDLENATLDTIEEITSNYEMQYDLLMKSYEIAKADLEVAKKKAQLNNVLNERNVRMFIDGQWQWVANTQDVINAKSELADAEYAQRMAEAGLTQQESINNLTAQQDQLGTIINQFESGVIDLDSAVGDIVRMFGELPSAMKEAFDKMNVRTSTSGLGYTSGYKPNIIANVGSTAIGVASRVVDRIKSSTPFATGTRYTPSGDLLLGEEEPEMFITNNGHLIPINQPTLGNFGAGGVVFNQDQMDFARKIWDWSNYSTLPVNLANNAHASSESFVFHGDINVYNPADAKDVADNVVNHIVQGLKLQRKSR